MYCGDPQLPENVSSCLQELIVKESYLNDGKDVFSSCCNDTPILVEKFKDKSRIANFID